jgi:hypothetical protein
VVLAPEPLGAEWLLVADPVQRYATPERTAPSGEDDSPFDAFESFGLDDDPPPEPTDPANWL